MRIGKELALIAKKKEICQKWFDQMKTFDDRNRLLEMYVHGIDFYLSNGFPTNDYTRGSFVGRVGEYGVHLDESLNTANDRRVVVLGRYIGWVEINNFGVSEIFVKYEPGLIIIAKGNSFVMADMFGDSKLHIIVSANSKVCVNYYGSTLRTESSEKAVIKVIEKYRKTY